jgi:hypothetical protein
MLYPLFVQDIAASARGNRASVALSTNAFWAATRRGAIKRLQELRAAGIDTLLLSADIYHEPYVPVECVLTAAKSAIDCGLNCEISIPSPQYSLATEHIVSLARSIPGVHVKKPGVARTGRARQLRSKAFSGGMFDHGCDVLGQLALMPDGYLYACCGASINFGRDSILCAGDYAVSDLPSLIARLQSTALLKDIQDSGPLRAAFAEKTRNPNFSLAIKSHYSDICSQCKQVCAAYEETLPPVSERSHDAQQPYGP